MQEKWTAKWTAAADVGRFSSRHRDEQSYAQWTIPDEPPPPARYAFHQALIVGTNTLAMALVAGVFGAFLMYIGCRVWSELVRHRPLALKRAPPGSGGRHSSTVTTVTYTIDSRHLPGRALVWLLFLLLAMRLVVRLCGFSCCRSHGPDTG